MGDSLNYSALGVSDLGSTIVSRRISDTLIYNHKITRKPFVVSEESANEIINNNSEIVDWVNLRFFGGLPRLKGMSEGVLVGDENELASPNELVELFSKIVIDIISDSDRKLEDSKKEILFLQARIEAETGRLSEALDKFLRYSTLSPKDPRPHRQVAGILKRKKAYSDAYDEILKAIDLCEGQNSEYIRFRDDIKDLVENG